MSMKLMIICLLVTVAVAPAAAAPMVQGACPALWNPVCGSDGNTYPNVICMNVSDPSLEVAHEGECAT